MDEVLQNKQFIQTKLIARWQDLAADVASGVRVITNDQASAPEVPEGVFDQAVPIEAHGIARRKLEEDQTKVKDAIPWWQELLEDEEAFDQLSQVVDPANAPSREVREPPPPPAKFSWSKLPNFRQPVIVPSPEEVTLATEPCTEVPGEQKLFFGHEQDRGLFQVIFDASKDVKVNMVAICRIEQGTGGGDEKWGVGLIKAVDESTKTAKIQWHVPTRRTAAGPPEDATWAIWQRRSDDIDLEAVQWATWWCRSSNKFKSREKKLVADVIKNIVDNYDNVESLRALRPGELNDPEDDDE